MIFLFFCLLFSDNTPATFETPEPGRTHSPVRKDDKPDRDDPETPSEESQNPEKPPAKSRCPRPPSTHRTTHPNILLKIHALLQGQASVTDEPETFPSESQNSDFLLWI